jgi:hypothetical protein
MSLEAEAAEAVVAVVLLDPHVMVALLVLEALLLAVSLGLNPRPDFYRALLNLLITILSKKQSLLRAALWTLLVLKHSVILVSNRIHSKTILTIIKVS